MSSLFQHPKDKVSLNFTPNMIVFHPMGKTWHNFSKAEVPLPCHLWGMKFLPAWSDFSIFKQRADRVTNLSASPLPLHFPHAILAFFLPFFL